MAIGADAAASRHRRKWRAGHFLGWTDARLAGGDNRLCRAVRERLTVSLDLWLAGLTAIGLLVYLVAVLLRPERFW